MLKKKSERLISKYSQIAWRVLIEILFFPVSIRAICIAVSSKNAACVNFFDSRSSLSCRAIFLSNILFFICPINIAIWEKGKIYH